MSNEEFIWTLGVFTVLTYVGFCVLYRDIKLITGVYAITGLLVGAIFGLIWLVTTLVPGGA